MNGLTAEDVIELRDWNNKREDVTMSGRINGVCAIALAALSPPVTADGGMPGEPHVIREARTLHAEGNVIGLEKRLVIAYEELRTFALREHQGRRAAEGIARHANEAAAVAEQDRRVLQDKLDAADEAWATEIRLREASDSRAADLERRVGEAHEAHADCRTMLEGEHDAHMECHARAEKAEGSLRDVFGLIESGYLVRDTSKDNLNQGWAMTQIDAVQKLAKAKSLIAQSVEAGKEGGRG